MTLRVAPEGLTAIAARVEALAARMAAVTAAATPIIGAVVPPAVDPVSLQTSLTLSARGISHANTATHAAAELGRAGIGVGNSAASYAAADVQAAASYPGLH